ncbi:MAG: DUF4412 domain-containing protein [Desulfobaccales bacterium]
MHLQSRLIFMIFLTSWFLLGAGWAQGAEFTATLITHADGREIPGKVFVKGEKVRYDVQIEGQSGINILRPDKKLMWVILPGQKTYMEMPVTSPIQQNMMSLSEAEKSRMKKIGTETINGYVCDKYEATLDHHGRSDNFFVWMAQDLGLPIKMMAQDGSMGMEYRDITKKDLTDALFEAPQGYRKLKMPFPMAPTK